MDDSFLFRLGPQAKKKKRDNINITIIKVTKDSDQKDRRDENLPWIGKYRPTYLSEVYSQTERVTILRKFISKNRLPRLLFYGPPGTGKTSTVV